MRDAEAAAFLRRLGGSWQWNGTILRRRMVAGWIPPAQQAKAALKLIEPAPERRVRCERQLARAFDLVVCGKANDKRPSPKADKEQYREFARLLQAVETSGMDIYMGRFSFMKQVRKWREFFEELADRINVGHGKKRRSDAKQFAADAAYRLLAKFGSSPPTLTRGGPWDQLATILYGDSKADLYDYLRTSEYAPRKKRQKSTAV